MRVQAAPVTQRPVVTRSLQDRTFPQVVTSSPGARWGKLVVRRDGRSGGVVPDEEHDDPGENIADRDLATASKQEQPQQKRWLKDRDADERPGANPQEQPGMPGRPTSPAEGGD